MNKFYLLTQNKAESGHSGESLGTLFDLTNSCKTCGTGAVVRNKLVVSIKKTFDFIQTLNDDFLISERIYNAINSTHPKSIENIKQVINKKGELLPYYFLTSVHVLPKMLDSSEGIQTDNQCSACKRDGYFDKPIIGNLSLGIKTKIIPPKYKYNIKYKEDLDMSDLYITWECFGHSNLIRNDRHVIRYARPKIVVSEKIKSVFENLGVKNVVFNKIVIF